jgi:hypothetical protein
MVQVQNEKCKAEGCNNLSHTNGYCQKHYARLRRHGTLERLPSGKKKSEPKYCDICGDKCFGKGLCLKHYQQKYRNGTLPLKGSIRINLPEEMENEILKIMEEKDMTSQEVCILLLGRGIKSFKKS